MEKKTRNRRTRYGLKITIRVDEEKFKEFKRICEKRGIPYGATIRNLMDMFSRQNS